MNINDISNNQQSPKPFNECSNLGEKVGTGIILAGTLLVTGICMMKICGQEALDITKDRKWSRLSNWDKVKSIATPVLLSGTGLLIVLGGIGSSYIVKSQMSSC